MSATVRGSRSSCDSLPDLVLTPEGWQPEGAIAITDGRVAAVQAAGAFHRGDVALPGRARLPGTVNSHCQTFSDCCAGSATDLDFTGWRERDYSHYIGGYI